MRFLKFKTRKAKIFVVSGLVLIAILVVAGILYASDSSNQETAVTTEQPPTEVQEPQEEPVKEDENIASEPTVPPATTPPSQPSQPPTSSQWPVQLTSSQAASITVVVNKKHKLPSTYVPQLTTVSGGQLRTEAATAFNSLQSAAKAAGISNMIFVSGYRSYAKQEQLYNNYVAQDGQAAADTYSARPGFSEHQTGLAVDIGDGGSCDLETCFENTAAAKWAATNAYKYGFIIRYPKGKEATTGYQYEPWHLRYLGVGEATAVYNSGKTLEEYYNIPGGGYE